MGQQGGGGGGSGDLDQLLEDAYTQKQQQSKSKSAQDWQTLKPKTELGKSVNLDQRAGKVLSRYMSQVDLLEIYVRACMSQITRIMLGT